MSRSLHPRWMLRCLSGFPDATIVAWNDLDEHIIESLKAQGAKIAVWGVGTKLATAYDQPALGGVYRLGAMKDAAGEWHPKVKLSEQAAKTTIPGVLQVRRFQVGDKLAGDMIYDETRGIDTREILVDVKDGNRRKRVPVGEDLLAPVMRGGALTGSFAEGVETLETARRRAARQLADLHPSVRRLLNPHEHPVGIEVGLHERREQMIREVRWDFAEQE